ncbi:Major royal jelly protein [Sarracenia purpurea var. burkii]
MRQIETFFGFRSAENRNEKIFVIDNNNNGHNSNNNIYKSPPKRRVFVTLPRFKSGVPVTVASVTNTKRGDTTLLAPFPNWSTQREDNCETGITSVYRTKTKCGVLWILDSGRVENFSPNPRKLCPPKVLAYDLNNGDKLIGRYEIPQHVLDQDSLLVTIAIDTRDTLCTDPFLYIADVTAFKLIVYDVEKNRSWRIGSNLFYPFPLYGNFEIAGTRFNLMDGLLALALGPVHNGDRRLYFHSLASVREGSVPVSVLRNQSLFADDADSSWQVFTISEPARPSQSASEDMSSTGILFFGLLSQMAIACWNSRTPFTHENIHITQQDNHTLQFPSGIKIFGDTIYVMTSELQNFIAGTQKINDVKYRILVGSVSDLVRGTGCEQRSDECLTQSSHFPTTAHQCFDHTAKLDPVPHPVLNFPFADSNGGENVAYEMAAPVGPTFRRNAHDLGRFRRIFSVSAPLFRYY